MRFRRSLWALLLAGSTFAADDPGGWSAAKWGMTEDQLLSSVPGSSRLAGDTDRRTVIWNSGKTQFTAVIGVDFVEIGGMPWKALFVTPGNTLVRILLQPVRAINRDAATFQQIEQLLVRKYGRPFERDVKEDGTQTRSAMWSFPTTVITLKYVDLRPRLTLQFLSLTYEKREPDNL